MKQLSLIAATVLLSLPFWAEAKIPAANMQNSKAVKQQNLLVELTGQDISKENDMTLYAEMVSAFQREDEIAFKSRLQALLSRFPKSIYADNALFLAGRMAVANRNYPEAVRYFARIENEYPKSNKVAAARFAKAMTYKKMNLPEFAKKNFIEIRKKYAGSPESFRSDGELKLTK